MEYHVNAADKRKRFPTISKFRIILIIWINNIKIDEFLSTTHKILNIYEQLTKKNTSALASKAFAFAPKPESAAAIFMSIPKYF